MNLGHKNFVQRHHVARLATTSADGTLHVVPVCFALAEDTLYITIDQKPKLESSKPLQRLRNITANPAVALVVDHYAEDWSELGWVMFRGSAEVLVDGTEHDTAQTLLKQRYAQYREMELSGLPVIAIRVSRTTAWGKLD